MFSKLITKFRSSKAPKFSFVNSQFQLNGLNFIKISPKQFRVPTFDLAKIIQFTSAYLQSLQTFAITLNTTRILARIHSRAQKISKYANRKIFLGSLAGSLGLYYAYEYNPLMTKILLSYEATEFNEKLISGLTHLHNVHFYPSFLCTTPLLQAIMNKSPPEAAVHYTREPILLPDGGQITLDWALPTRKVDYMETPLHGRYYPYQPLNDNKIMFIIHGLTGGSETNYIQSIVDKARKDGYRVVVMNQRGVNQPLSTPFPFHGGTLDDLEAGLAHVQKKYPDAPILAVGTSFGGNQLIRYLGQEETKVKIVGGVLLAAPFDIDDCVDQIQNTLYEKFFIKNYLEKNFLPNIDIFKSLKESHGVDINQVMAAKSLKDYHSHFTVKLFEHKDVREYFMLSKVSEKQINNIKIPLLVLHAKDDPIALHKSIPIETLKKNRNIIYAETKRGGHLCWFSGFRPKRWYNRPTIEFLDKVLEATQAQKKLKLAE